MAESIGKLFAPLTDLIGGALELLHASGLPWWLSIVALTLVVRAVLLPLTVKQVKNARSMQGLKPEMEELRARHKEPREQQRALADLYRERGVNPMAGFLPLLVQMPVFITVYHVIRSYNEHLPGFARGGALWFTDLTGPDPYLALPVISAGLMLAAFEVSSKGAPLQQRRVMRLMPLAFTVFIARFPAGLFVYWVTSNAVTLGQNLTIERLSPRPKMGVGDELEETRLGDETPKVSGAGDSQSTKSQAEKAAKRRRRKRKKHR